MVAERIKVLQAQKTRLEEQITQDTGNEIDLPEAFAGQRREKLAETIKELKILTDEQENSNGIQG